MATKVHAADRCGSCRFIREDSTTGQPRICAQAIGMSGPEDKPCALYSPGKPVHSVRVSATDDNPFERALGSGWVNVSDLVDELFGGYVDMQITQDTDRKIEAVAMTFNRYAQNVALPLRLRFMGVRDGTAVVVPYFDTNSQGYGGEPEWTEVTR